MPVPAPTPPRAHSRAGATLTALLAALAALAALGLPATATANPGSKILKRCLYGKPIGGFPVQAYRQALRNMPTEVSEYGECAELIEQAELAAAAKGQTGGKGHNSSTKEHNPGGALGGGAGGGPGTGSGPGSGPGAGEASGNSPLEATPAEQQAIEHASTSGNHPVTLGGAQNAAKPVIPGVVHADIASAASSIPAPLLAILAILAALLVALAGRALAAHPAAERPLHALQALMPGTRKHS